MKEFIDKLIERLKEERNNADDKALVEFGANGHSLDFEYLNGRCGAYNHAISIVNELAEEYKAEHIVDLCNQFCDKADEILRKKNNGWIPCSERLPEDGVKVLCYGSNALGRMRYEVSCYSHKLRWWKCSVITDVFAWMPLPTAPYTEGE